MSTATEIVRMRAAEALAALADCEDNAPWDADYCRRAIVENEALADLLDALTEFRARYPAIAERPALHEAWRRFDALEAAITARS